MPRAALMSLGRVPDDDLEDGAKSSSLQGAANDYTESHTIQGRLDQASNDATESQLLRVHTNHTVNDHDRRRAFQARLDQLENAYMKGQSSPCSRSESSTDNESCGSEDESKPDTTPTRGRQPERKQKRICQPEGYFHCDKCDRTFGPKALAITLYGQSEWDSYWCRLCFHDLVDAARAKIENVEQQQKEQEHIDSDLKCKKCDYLLGRKKRRFLDRVTGAIICRACFGKDKRRDSKSAEKNNS